jgi:iron(III) transport system permease protein
LILVFLSVPVASIVFISLGQSGDLWGHLFDTVLPNHILTTLWLMIGSVIGATIIGVSTAWVTSAYDFTGKTILCTLLTLPLAMPTYLMAYVWTDLLEYAGPFQNSLRSFFLWKSSQDYWFPEIQSLGGATFLFSFVLYPYIFILGADSFPKPCA